MNRRNLAKFTQSKGNEAVAFLRGADAVLTATMTSGDDDHWTEIDYREDGNEQFAWYVNLCSAPQGHDNHSPVDSPKPKYGVTWATKDHSIAQTGYVFDNLELAEACAKLGPDNQVVTVDSMGDEPKEGEKVWGRIECENDSHGEFLVEN